MDETQVENGFTIALYLLPSILGVLKNKKKTMGPCLFLKAKQHIYARWEQLIYKSKCGGVCVCVCVQRSLSGLKKWGVCLCVQRSFSGLKKWGVCLFRDMETRGIVSYGSVCPIILRPGKRDLKISTSPSDLNN
jgi:hypothetical protein